MAATPAHAARVLGLDDTATLEDVRRVRRQMAKKYHPDRAQDQERATRHMARINAAADTLLAHLKNRARPNADAPHAKARRKPQPSPTQDNAQRKSASARASSARASASEAKPASEKPFQASHDAADPTAKASPNTTAATHREERSRVRVATDAYLNVLSRIGPRHAGPKIDVRVLNFRTAA